MNKNMTQEERQLLLKDLCARLPYGVICNVEIKRDFEKLYKTDIKISQHNISYVFDIGTEWLTCKPYLRPMSSITEEEKEELSCYENSIQRADFYYSHHIDCRFMIEKGLAFEAPEGMYKTE